MPFTVPPVRTVPGFQSLRSILLTYLNIVYEIRCGEWAPVHKNGRLGRPPKSGLIASVQVNMASGKSTITCVCVVLFFHSC